MYIWHNDWWYCSHFYKLMWSTFTAEFCVSRQTTKQASCAINFSNSVWKAQQVPALRFYKALWVHHSACHCDMDTLDATMQQHLIHQNYFCAVEKTRTFMSTSSCAFQLYSCGYMYMYRHWFLYFLSKVHKTWINFWTNSGSLKSTNLQTLAAESNLPAILNVNVLMFSSFLYTIGWVEFHKLLNNLDSWYEKSIGVIY